YKLFPSGTRRCLKLWHFLLETLTDDRYKEVIRWVDREQGIFTIVESRKLAQMWGARKKHPGMTYEHLARAIRHYYRPEIISRIPGRRLVYQF
ncbi:hypothetical protein CAPTEDRAFT_68907, partial [Capitella teleta]